MFRVSSCGKLLRPYRRPCHHRCSGSPIRYFFSFLSPTESSSSSDSKAKAEEEKICRDALRRMSLQHAHPLGPWKAMSAAVKVHWESSVHRYGREHYRVMDLGCGPRGEPGTTIAHLLPLATVHCTDSCADSVDQVPLSRTTTTGMQELPRVVPPPENLTKSVLDMSDLSDYEANSFDAITCCYGYGLVAPDRLQHALSEAHRVLAPGGILVVATWQGSAMLNLGNDILRTVKNGGIQLEREDDAFVARSESTTIALSAPGELETILTAAGFAVASTFSSWGTYPFDMGTNADEMLATGTILIRQELHSLGAFSRAPEGSIWTNLAEEAFWTHVRKYADVSKGTTSMFLRENTFKMTVSTKQNEAY